MQWTTSSSARGPVGRAGGVIDDAVRDDFLGHLRAGIAEAAAVDGDFTIDLAAVEHLSGEALMALTIAREEAIRADVRIVLARPGEGVREILRISRYHLIFDIVETLDATES